MLTSAASSSSRRSISASRAGVAKTTSLSMPLVSGTAFKYCTEPMRNFGGSTDIRANFNAKARRRKGLKARKKIAQGKASLRAPPWVNGPQNFQALKGRQNLDQGFAP